MTYKSHYMTLEFSFHTWTLLLCFKTHNLINLSLQSKFQNQEHVRYHVVKTYFKSEIECNKWLYKNSDIINWWGLNCLMFTHIRTAHKSVTYSSSYTICTHDLPDIYTLSPRALGEYISGKPLVPMACITIK